MPVSKKRKKAVNGQRRMPAAPVRTERWAANLNGSRLMYLRNDPDFLTMIKIGRVTNAVAYGLTDVLGNDERKSALGRRQFRRGLFVLAGYLHEGIRLVQSIKGRYLTEPEFEPLRALALATEHKKTRDLVRTIRNATAFHLDEFDETTRQTLARMKPECFPLMSGDDQSLATFYFEFSDYVDWAFLIEKFADGRSREETSDDIVYSTMQFADKFLPACHNFQIALCKKTKIGEHVY